MSDLRERWRRLQHAFESSGDDEWWALVFARPMANVFLLPIADNPAVTPNRLTWLALIVGMIGIAAFAFGSYTAQLIGVAIIQLRCIIDSMDGHLSRYRGKGSALGAYLDKVTDSIFWTGLFFVLGYLAYAKDPHIRYFVFAFIASFSRIMINYIFWMHHFLRLEHEPNRKARHHEYRYPPTTIKGWLYSFVYMFNFAEPDFYFWISVFVVIGHVDWLMYFLAITHAGLLLLRTIQRGSALYAIDHARKKG